jgi:hypothetical protein
MIFRFPFHRRNLSREEKLSEITVNFFNHPLHYWIKQDNFVIRLLGDFFQKLDDNTIDFLFRSDELLFIPSNGKLSCTLSSYRKAHVIVIFPELMKLLKSCSPNLGLSILAHELGHIILEHKNKNLGPLLSQIEADQFAANIGYGEDLKEVLLDYQNVPECKLRLERLTEYLEKSKIKAPAIFNESKTA